MMFGRDRSQQCVIIAMSCMRSHGSAALILSTRPGFPGIWLCACYCGACWPCLPGACVFAYAQARGQDRASGQASVTCMSCTYLPSA